jgi:hypothetical protein
MPTVPEPLVREAATVRLVKGDFPRGHGDDHQRSHAITASYLCLVERCSQRAKSAGFYPVLGENPRNLIPLGRALFTPGRLIAAMM